MVVKEFIEIDYELALEKDSDVEVLESKAGAGARVDVGWEWWRRKVVHEQEIRAPRAGAALLRVPA